MMISTYIGIKGMAGIILLIFATALPYHVRAQTLEEATCYLFDGKTNCKKVKIIDRDNCVVKIYPMDMPIHDPESMGCLIEDLQTKTVSYKKLNRIAVTSFAGSTASPGDQSKFLAFRGKEALSVLAAYNDHGGPEWSERNQMQIPLQGDLKRTEYMVRHIEQKLCTHQSKIVVAERSKLLSQSKPRGPSSMSVQNAHVKSKSGEIVLIDVRRPSEWKQTGIAETALPITMHQEVQKFVQLLNRVQLKNPNKPIAFICASGGRSAFLQRTLPKYDIKNIVDVSEGMLGSSAGKGWIKSGLPVRAAN